MKTRKATPTKWRRFSAKKSKRPIRKSAITSKNSKNRPQGSRIIIILKVVILTTLVVPKLGVFKDRCSLSD